MDNIKDLILDRLNNGNRNSLNRFKFFLGFPIYSTGSINDGILRNMPDSRSLPIILDDMDHAGFKDVIFVTDRGYESLRNLETYIIKEMPFIACSEVGNGFVLEQIKSFGEFNTRPDDIGFLCRHHHGSFDGCNRDIQALPPSR